MTRLFIFGLNFDQINIGELLNKLLSPIRGSTIIVTPNVDHVIRYHKSKEFRDLYSRADIIVNDSRILRLLSFLCFKPNRCLIPGSDLTRKLFENISDVNIRISVIGGTIELIETLRNKYSVVSLSHYNPPMGFELSIEEVEKCVEFCAANPAQVYLLAVGSPRQEILACQLKDSGISGFFLCIGASLLFLGGQEKRAPYFIQILCLEWLFRLLQNPRRLARRYLIDGLGIFPIFIKQLCGLYR